MNKAARSAMIHHQGDKKRNFRVPNSTKYFENFIVLHDILSSTSCTHSTRNFIHVTRKMRKIWTKTITVFFTYVFGGVNAYREDEYSLTSITNLQISWNPVTYTFSFPYSYALRNLADGPTETHAPVLQPACVELTGLSLLRPLGQRSSAG